MSGYLFPVSGARISSPFGQRDSFRTSNGARSSSNHAGIDFAAPMGTPVVAPIGGTVTGAGTRGGYGNMVTVMGSDGVEHRFAHLQGMNVRRGQTIGAGAQLGTVGSTGNSTGPHLHYETRRDGRAFNPQSLLGRAEDAAKGALSRGLDAAQGAVRGVAESVPIVGGLLGATDALGITGECNALCQFQNWLKESGFVQRLALAVFAFILLAGAVFMMKANVVQGVMKKGLNV